jgi:dTDP-4-amino-4,6-dideoxygalactose transaminase
MSKVQVPYLDLGHQHEPLSEAFAAAFARIVQSGRFVLGEDVERFEEDFAAYCGVAHAVALNSGTSALHLALLATGIEPGDEVVMPAMTFVATAAAITYVGAQPVLVDVDRDSGCMDPDAVGSVLTPRTKAIVPVHLYGQPADMAAILEIAGRHQLVVIEDAAQAHGASYRGRRVGGLGDAAAFSFYPAKNLGAFGEGGAVATDDEGIARRVRQLRDWGQGKKGIHALAGFNCRMDAVQGAVLRIKLDHLEHWNAMRRSLAGEYGRRLADYPIVLPKSPSDRQHAYHVFAVRHPRRDSLRSWLAERGIQCGIHYPNPIHLVPAYADLEYREGDFPHAEAVAREELSLPIFPGMSDDQIELVAAAIGSFFARK